MRRGARRGGTVLTADVLTAAQRLLDNHWSRAEVADELAVKDDTLRKALDPPEYGVTLTSQK